MHLPMCAVIEGDELSNFGAHEKVSSPMIFVAGNFLPKNILAVDFSTHLYSPIVTTQELFFCKCSS